MRTLHIEYIKHLDMNLIFNNTGREDLQGNFEINQKNLISSMNGKSAFIEGGWYFNNYPKMRALFPNHRIHYIVLNPPIEAIHKNYLMRHPRSKKHISNDFVKWDRVIYNVRSRSAMKLVNDVKIQTTVFTEEILKSKVSTVVALLENNKERTIYIITGSNCAGKSTLYKYVKEEIEKKT